MKADQAKHANQVAHFTTGTLISIKADLTARNATKKSDHEQRWIIQRLNAVRAELRKRQATTS